MEDNEQTERISGEREAERTDECWNGYRVRYDKAYLMKAISELGITNEITADLMARAIACYAAGFGKKMNEIFEHLAESHEVQTNAIAMRFKRALGSAENSGALKYVDTIVSGAVYDYDYGYTVKEFIALLGAHMGDTGRLTIEKE